MKKLLLLLLLIVPYKLHAQGTQIVTLAADPPTCNPGMMYFNSGSNTMKACGPANTWAAVGGGIQLVASLPATCTPGVTANVQLNAASGGFIAGTEFYCYSTNTWQPTGNIVNSVGTFTSASSQEYLQSIIGASNCNTFLNGTTKVTDAISGCLIGPSSGTTNGFSDAVAGYAQVNDPNQGGQFTAAEVVGVYGNCQAAASHSKCIGVAPQASSTASLTGEVIEGMEVGMIPGSTTTTGWGLLLGFLGSNVQPAGDNMPAVMIQTPSGSGTYTTGFECGTGSSPTYCMRIGQTAAGSGVNSQAIGLSATNAAAGAVSAGIQLYYDNGLILGTPAVILSNTSGPETVAPFFTSTNALPINSLVKIDTGHADSFVLCTTADNTCQGFVQGTSTAGGSCVATSTLCPIATVSGVKVQGIVGTGTCSIGNAVIVDTTTNGRVKCQAGIPAQGSWIGTALSSQSSVGSLVDILTKFQ